MHVEDTCIYLNIATSAKLTHTGRLNCVCTCHLKPKRHDGFSGPLAIKHEHKRV